MLIEFEIENYLSFRDRISFSLEKTLIRQQKNHVFSGKIPVLSGATIYGANASGKSNLFYAIKTVVELIKDNKEISSLGLPKNKYMGIADRPSYFSFTFQSDQKIYRYSFTTSDTKILSEKLSILDNKKNEKLIIFDRAAGRNTIFCKDLQSIEWYQYRTAAEYLLLLPKLKSDGVLERKEKYISSFKDAFDFFEDFIFSSQEYNFNELPLFYFSLQKDEFKNYLLNLLKAADLGITGIQYQPINEDAALSFEISLRPNEKAFLRDRNGNFYYLSFKNEKIICEKLILFHGDKKFDMQQESRGTLKLIELSLAFYLTRKLQKKILFIDELSSSLHPKLIEFLLTGTMKDLQITKSQIIITSHDLYMLSEKFWRKDQIWFTEKEVSGNSTLTCLSDMDTRHDKSVFKNYLNGLYGGIPILPTEAL